MNTVRAVCFDLDDTLYDYQEDAEAGLHSAADLIESRTGESVREELFELYFDRGVTDETFDRLLEGVETDSKHEVEVFKSVLSELSVPPAHAMYVGDDPRVDFRVPNDLGMVTVRIRCGRYADLEPSDEASAPDHEIDDLGELLLYPSDSKRA